MLFETRLVLIYVTSLLAFLTTADAQSSFPNYPEPDLPSMGACVNSAPQPLPERWQATTLMAPYLYTGKSNDLDNLSSRAELQVGRLVYDGENGLMRSTLRGAKLGGVIDLLISEKATYVLTGSYENPQCLATLAKPYKVPSRTWQDQKFKPVCVGNHAVAPTIDSGPKVDWWKQQSPVMEPGALGEAADWFWFDEKGYPTRTMFWYKHDGLPAILGDYAFTNFYQFGSGNDIDVNKILATCESAKLPVWNDDKAHEQQTKRVTAARQEDSAGKLIPGLSYKACSALKAKPPTWPVSFYMSSFSTAAKYSTPKPLVTSVYFKPDEPMLRTRLHEVASPAPYFVSASSNRNGRNAGPDWSDALLIRHDSYGVDFSATPPYSQKSCARGPHTSLPGSPHKNWGVAGRCQCMSVIENNPVLSPGRNTEIIGCPLPLVATKPGEQSGNTMFWMWYTITDPMQPIVFLQSKPDVTIGTGLSLADYAHWQPKSVPNDIFTRPPADSCPPPPASAPAAPMPCMGCHNLSTNN
ncbi:hypothetical protein ACVJGD_005493 [Bradyrhizobium sp. USDA 10063]